MLFKRLFYLLHVLQKTYIVGETVGALRDLRKNAQHVVIEFSRISLSRNAIYFCIAELFDDLFFELADFCAVPFEEVEKARLRAGSALYAAQFDRLFQVHERNVIHL